MGLFRFFKDLFSARKPCELCRLGAEQWEARRSGAADWKIQGHGLSAELFICESCALLLSRTGANQKNAILVLGQLVRAGYARRPLPRTLLRHPTWETIWRHSLQIGGVTTVSVEETLSRVGSLFDDIVQTDLRDEVTGEIRDQSLYALHEAALSEAK